MSQEDTLNWTELASLIRGRHGVIIKRSVPRERLLEIVASNTSPNPEELASSNESRRKLQVFIDKNWKWIESQLPCKGENRGKCTIYNCPEGRHADCLIGAGPQLKMHSL